LLYYSNLKEFALKCQVVWLFPIHCLDWNNKAKTGTLAGTKQYSPDLNALLEENKKLKQQLKTAEMEREFLKKAAAYFAKESQ